MNRAVFIDRDGVLNDVVLDGDVASSPRTYEQWRISPGAAQAVHRLRAAGLVVVVVTNQPDIARAKMDETELARMHADLAAEVRPDAIEVCPHDDADRCACRKPRPGMITRAAERMGIDLGASWTIGDRWVDVDAGAAAGTRTILTRRPYSDRRRPASAARADIEVSSLTDAVDQILRELSGR